MAESPLATLAKIIVLWERIKWSGPTPLDPEMDDLLADLSISLSEKPQKVETPTFGQP